MFAATHLFMKKAFIVVTVIFWSVFLWKSFVSYDVYFPVATKDELRISTVFEPHDLETYKELIPQQFEIADQPMVKIDFVQVTPDWHELYVSIRVNYKNEECWHALTWAIDSYFPYALGRWAGYPKFMADSFNCSIEEKLLSTSVVKDGEKFISLDFTETPNASTEYRTSVWEKAELYHLLSPPLEGPQINKMTFFSLISRDKISYTEVFGDIKIACDMQQPWAKLIGETGERTADGFYSIKDSRDYQILRGKAVN